MRQPDGLTTVVAWDPSPARVELVRRRVADAGRCDFVLVGGPSELVRADRRTRIALISLGGRPEPGSRELEIVRALKEKNCRVICYEDGSQDWPLGIRCLPLLAGCECVLDSSQPGFEQELGRTLERALRAQRAEEDSEALSREQMRELGVIGASAVMLAAFRRATQAATLSDLPTLIMGETGTGKELFARAIHQLDRKRRSGPFVPVNCGAISAGLAESELFGHRHGAFTGAETSRRGLIRSAHGGVLFLDEIGDLDLALQTKLLRVLQDNRVLAVGEDREEAVDVRVIAATHRDLDRLTADGRFRADLFHRLNVLTVHIPPLRQRPEDLKPLIEHLLQKHRHLAPDVPVSVQGEFIESLAQIELPGNVRQLENIVRRALANKTDDADDAPLGLADLPSEVWTELTAVVRRPVDQPMAPAAAPAERPAAPPPPDVRADLCEILGRNDWGLEQALRHYERKLVEAALRAARGNQSQTARLLKITPRSVYNKLRKYRLSG